MHEAKMHGRNCFVTLTYEDAPVSLDHRHWQLFAKRARRELGPFRFYMAGEYGELNARPHYHACLFGVDFDDKVYAGRSPGGAKLYSSDCLSQLWKLGFTSVGAVTFESAAYVARYVMKKITGEGAAAHYGDRVPEYCRMSNGGRGGKRGIGFGWFDAFGKTDVLPTVSVLVGGRRCSPPRYYRKLLREKYPISLLSSRPPQGFLESVAEQLAEGPDNGRVAAREKVADARLRMLKRKL